MVDLYSQRIPNKALEGSDGTTVFEVAKFLAVVGVLVALLVVSTSIRNEILSLRYEIEELKRSNAQLDEANQLLEIEYRSLATPAEIEEVAKEIGLISANDSKVLILEADRVYTPAPSQIAQSQIPREVLHE
ncbi:MAG: septum formation initiator family protein [Acidobacteriota bacterium]|nr:MAG: septum formation initiator family protein [Acidobacteriota bacterium]